METRWYWSNFRTLLRYYLKCKRLNRSSVSYKSLLYFQKWLYLRLASKLRPSPLDTKMRLRYSINVLKWRLHPCLIVTVYSHSHGEVLYQQPQHWLTSKVTIDAVSDSIPYTPWNIKNVGPTTSFLIITLAFLVDFYTFCTSGKRKEYSTHKLTQFTTSP